MSEEAGVIYCIENKQNGKMYIGLTVDYKTRLSHHRCCLSAKKHINTHLENAWHKYGEDSFEFYILEEGIPKSELPEREKYYIDKYNTFNNGYNLTSGGEENFEVAEETRKKMSEINTGRERSEEFKQKMSEVHSGKTTSEETRGKMRQTKQAKRMDREHRKQISLIFSSVFRKPVSKLSKNQLKRLL